MKELYYSFNEYLKSKFNTRVQRVSVNAGFSCPNRDGTLSSQGCIFCNEDAFVNFSTTEVPLAQQITSSIEFFKKRFKAEKFIAYFQNASNTYAPVDDLKKAYDTIRQFPEIVGLFISTRPDCIDQEKLKLIASYRDAYDVWIEYGLQSCHDTTLTAINRSHTFSQFADAVKQTVEFGITVGAHVIIGLPDENRNEVIAMAKALSGLPVFGVKIHALHVVAQTKLAQLYEAGRVQLVTQEAYVGLVCDFLEHLRSDIVIMRCVSNAKPDVLIAPQWINQKQKVIEAIEKEFKERGTRQGSAYMKG